jgi:hypothetical protein
MSINYKYLFVITTAALIWWIYFTPFSEENTGRVKELEEINALLIQQKDSLEDVAISLKAEKDLYLDSARFMTIKFEEAESMKKRLIIGYEKILSNISDMSAVEHTSFYEARYTDNDN